MKLKLISILLLLIVFCSLALISQAQSVETKYWTFASGGPGGLWMQIGTVLGELWKTNIEGIEISPIPGGGNGNPITIGTGKADIGLGHTTSLPDAWEGIGDYEKYDLKNLRALGRLNQIGCGHFAVTKEVAEKYNLKSVLDLAKEKPPIKLIAGTRGSTDEKITRQMLEIIGWTFKDIQKAGGELTFAESEDGVQRITDGQANAIGFFEVPGDPSVYELTSARDVVFLDYDKEVMDRLVELNYLRTVIPAGTYKGQTEDLKTPGADNVVTTTEDKSEELIYQMTMVLLKNKERLANAHDIFTNFVPEDANTQLPIPLHPGAERAYKELGY